MKRLFALFLAGGMGLTALAQTGDYHRCGSDHYYKRHLYAHPEVVQERIELEKFTQKFAENYDQLKSKSGASITIPVVFHVNDPNNPQKVTLAQVQSAIDILNEDYSATNADINNIIPEFAGIVANMDIQFCLASKDPQGNPTTGITYHYNNYNGREPDGYGSSVKGVEYWPGNKYLNVWIVNETEDDGSLYNSGWAFLPDSWVANQNLDGIVYNHQYLGYTGSSEVSGPTSWQAEMARVLTHEVGHYLNLHHTFENYCSSPGDYVNDTPPVYYHGSNNCDQLGTFCSGVTAVNDQNYMDYTPCPSMFTEGQKTRVLAALNSSVAGRNNLWTESNLIATGCLDDVSVEENNISISEIYPNPAQDLLNIDFELLRDEECVLQIHNILGDEIYFAELILRRGESQHMFDISEYPNGVYTVTLKSKNQQLVRKVVKQ